MLIQSLSLVIEMIPRAFRHSAHDSFHFILFVLDREMCHILPHSSTTIDDFIE